VAKRDRHIIVTRGASSLQAPRGEECAASDRIVSPKLGSVSPSPRRTAFEFGARVLTQGFG